MIDIVALIDAEIASLQQVRTLITGTLARRKPGRPPKSAAAAKPKQKHKLSPEGRARIVEAVRRRWAAQKKSAK
jgi:hypothetical protein